jgi:erythromycin esterase-like protein
MASPVDSGNKEQYQKSYPLQRAGDLGPLLERIGPASCVMLGEASHGTHEFYTWRAALTRRLIRENGFNFIAVEGDWPDCYKMNRYIKGLQYQDQKAEALLQDFNRWPTWMWANWEVSALLNWLKEYNAGYPVNKKVGFYGLDVYSLWESMETVVSYLEQYDPHTAPLARKAIKCFEPYGEDEYAYARSQSRFTMADSCRGPLLKLLAEIRKKAVYYDHDPEAALNIDQNAEIAVNAEEYYSYMMRFNDSTWNLRDLHMMKTLQRLFDFYGKGSKGIVWEHNTHIGDARYTDMKDSEMINTGQLAREQIGKENVALVGFGTYSGTVIAGTEWGAEMEIMPVPEAKKGSVEALLHEDSEEDRYLIFEQQDKSIWGQKLPHRAIGVVYDPAREQYGNYVPTILNARYDAFIFLDKTKALHPLHLKPEGHKMPETYPFNF